MSIIVKNYINGLKNAYYKNDCKKEWQHFEKVIYGAEEQHIDTLKQVYPYIPNELISLLKYVDGTYYRIYAEEEVQFYLLGSDVYEYPYYLLSSEEIIENQNLAKKYYSDYIERKYDGVEIDDKITNKADSIKWLHFSDCMNNGGTSRLFIDFSPSEKGKKGQIVRFLHDPDEFKVIADSFEDYLKKLMDNKYEFINEYIK